MFEKITIRRHDSAHRIDPGSLAEALIFYQKVDVVLDATSLGGLLEAIGPDNLLQLIGDKRIEVAFLTDHLVVQTNTPPFGMPVHRFIPIAFAFHADGRPYEREHLVQQAFERTLGKTENVRAKADRFINQINFRGQDDGSLGADLISLANNDLADAEFVKMAVGVTVADRCPVLQLPHDWFFKPILRGDGSFVVDTNLNFELLNKLGAKDNSISSAWLAATILEVRADLGFAASYSSELITDGARSKIIQKRFSQFLRRRAKSASDIEFFQDIHLDNARAVREAVNSGNYSFDEFLRVLDQADRFKEWLRGVNPEAKLLREYYDAATRDTWAEKLPAKMARFAICTIAGAVLEALYPGGPGQTASKMLDLVDSLWADKVIKGWRPSQFVNGPLKQFIDDSSAL